MWGSDIMYGDYANMVYEVSTSSFFVYNWFHVVFTVNYLSTRWAGGQ